MEFHSGLVKCKTPEISYSDTDQWKDSDWPSWLLITVSQLYQHCCVYYINHYSSKQWPAIL
jgi:hypothetical protein